MSMGRKETVTCPKCGQAQDYIIWHTLNGDMNPVEKQQLLDGTLFRFECKNCGHKSNVNYGILYHDMTHRAMVYYVDESSVEHTKETMLDAERMSGFDMPGYRKRIVTDQNALREKAIIFEHGLDDRVVEIIKLVYYANASERFPDANIRAVYFLVVDEKYCLEFIGDQPLSAEIPAGVYDDIKKDYADRFNGEGDAECIVDMQWASKILKGH